MTFGPARVPFSMGPQAARPASGQLRDRLLEFTRFWNQVREVREIIGENARTIGRDTMDVGGNIRPGRLVVLQASPGSCPWTRDVVEFVTILVVQVNGGRGDRRSLRLSR